MKPFPHPGPPDCTEFLPPRDGFGHSELRARTFPSDLPGQGTKKDRPRTFRIP